MKRSQRERARQREREKAIERERKRERESPRERAREKERERKSERERERERSGVRSSPLLSGGGPFQTSKARTWPRIQAQRLETLQVVPVPFEHG